MKKIYILTSAFIFGAVCASAQQAEGPIHITFQDAMIVKVMAENNKLAYQKSLSYDEGGSVFKRYAAAADSIRTVEVEAPQFFARMFPDGKVRLDPEKFKQLLREYNGDLTEQAVNAKINKAFLKFTASKEDHKKEYYKMLAKDLAQTLKDDVKEDILRSGGNVEFYDSAEFRAALGITDTFDTYFKNDAPEVSASSSMDDSDKIIDRVRLVLRIGGARNLSIALMPSGCPCVCSMRVHEWRRSEYFAGNVFEAQELFRENNAQLTEQLKKAGAPDPCKAQTIIFR